MKWEKNAGLYIHEGNYVVVWLGNKKKLFDSMKEKLNSRLLSLKVNSGLNNFRVVSKAFNFVWSPSCTSQNSLNYIILFWLLYFQIPLVLYIVSLSINSTLMYVIEIVSWKDMNKDWIIFGQISLSTCSCVAKVRSKLYLIFHFRS